MDVEGRWAVTQRNFLSLQKKLGPSRIRQYEDTHYKSVNQLPSSLKKERAHYLKTREAYLLWKTTHALHEDLAASYRLNPSLEPHESEAMRTEAGLWAYALIRAIEELRGRYGKSSFPIVNNFLIHVKMKKRGFCYHWTEDLLRMTASLPRQYFTPMWGEANAGKMMENNGMVLVPRGAPFESGIVIDPWRSAGKPFWVEVKKDHYAWRPWRGYY